MSNPIRPTVGRIVWYYPGRRELMSKYTMGEPLAAIITVVWSHDVVNLTVFDRDGLPHGVQEVEYVEVESEHGRWCWMPYQRQQMGLSDKSEEIHAPD